MASKTAVSYLLLKHQRHIENRRVVEGTRKGLRNCRSKQAQQPVMLFSLMVNLTLVTTGATQHAACGYEESEYFTSTNNAAV